MLMHSDRVQAIVRIAAWGCLLAIAIITVGPIGIRPETNWSPTVERFTAFALVGVLFAVAYPRYILVSAAIVLGAAVMFEFLQLLEPSRHGRAFDAGVKIIGGMAGLTAGWLPARLFPRR
jgi:apolipoprotein N-acyltransferase